MSDDSEGVEESFRAKVTENSAKLPYFHRVLSEHDKALIGDTSPKALTSTDAIHDESKKLATTAAARSAWNAANTWEEKDCSAWARSQIELLFSTPFTVKSKKGTTTITTVSNVSGSAQINQVRGKTRYLYEYALELHFEMISDLQQKIKGKMILTDLINDMLDDMDISVVWFESGVKLDSISKNSLIVELKKAVTDKMHIFEEVFAKNFNATVPSSSSTTQTETSNPGAMKLNLPQQPKKTSSAKKGKENGKTHKTEIGSIVWQACAVAALLLVGSVAMTYWRKNR